VTWEICFTTLASTSFMAAVVLWVLADMEL
jgi:hypothetical protein